MMKLFLSQPMTGYSDDEIHLERLSMLTVVNRQVNLAYENILKVDPLLRVLMNNFGNVDDQHFEVIDQIHWNARYKKVHPNCTMKDLLLEDLKLMMEGEDTFVVFHPRYKKSVGCKIEHKICAEYGIPYFYLTKDWRLVSEDEKAVMKRLKKKTKEDVL